MSMVLLYKDTIVTDRCEVMKQPYAPFLRASTVKMHVASDKTFVFGTIGPTLTSDEKNLLETMIRDMFVTANGEVTKMYFNDPTWIAERFQMCLLLMTKTSSYYMSHDFKGVGETKQFFLEQFDSHYHPAAFGTGMYAATMAAIAGVPMDKVVWTTAQVIRTVSADGDIFHRNKLRQMRFKNA